MSEYRYYLNAGIDFGTSYTKVYVEDQFTGRRKPVLFGNNKIGLLPSYVRCHDKRVLGPLDGADGFCISYLKLFLADEASGRRDFDSLYRVDGQDIPNARILVTGYFAALLTYIAKFLGQESVWKDFSLDRDLLTAQVAVPTGLQSGDLMVETRILECLKAARRIVSEGESHPSFDAIQQRLDTLATISKEEQTILDHSCKFYPEVAAAVQAMLHSGDLPEGKYITLDVGAGTVDMNFFFKRGSAKYGVDTSIDSWVSKVTPLGCACLGDPHEGAGEHEKTGIGMNLEIMRGRLSDEIRNLMQRVFLLQPRRVTGNGGDVFHHGMHAYIFGGGANVPIYAETLKATLDQLDVKVAQVMRLPRPDLDFVLPNGVDDFGRLAVAYGVSSAPENMSTARLPDEMERILGRALQAARIVRSDGEIACSCYSNPDCMRCCGKGYFRGRGLRANLNALSLCKAKEEISEKKAPAIIGTWSETEKRLSKMLTIYGKMNANDSFKYSRREICILDRFAVLKQIELCILSLTEGRFAKWKSDASGILYRAAREPRRVVYAEIGSGARSVGGVIANLNVAADHQYPNFKEASMICDSSEVEVVLGEINGDCSICRMTPLMVKLIVPTVDEFALKSVTMDVRSMKSHNRRSATRMR